MQVKTVRMGMYEDYDRTNLFYKSCGFREFEVFPLLLSLNPKPENFPVFFMEDRIENAAHNSNDDDPETVNRAIDSFLM